MGDSVARAAAILPGIVRDRGERAHPGTARDDTGAHWRISEERRRRVSRSTGRARPSALATGAVAALPSVQDQRLPAHPTSEPAKLPFAAGTSSASREHARLARHWRNAARGGRPPEGKDHQGRRTDRSHLTQATPAVSTRSHSSTDAARVHRAARRRRVGRRARADHAPAIFSSRERHRAELGTAFRSDVPAPPSRRAGHGQNER